MINVAGYLATFLDFITYSYMIDNIILLITGTLHQRPISELVPKCHPLGSFEQVITRKQEDFFSVLFVLSISPFTWLLG